MSLGSRIVRRGKAAVPVSSGLLSTPREWPCQSWHARWVSTGGRAFRPDGEQEDSSISMGPLDSSKRQFEAMQLDRNTSSPSRLPNDSSEYSSSNPRNLTNLSYPAGAMRNRDSRLVTHPDKPMVRRVVQKAEQRLQMKNYEKHIRQQYADEALLLGDAPSPNWRLVLQQLESHTPQRSETWHDSALKIVVPAAAVSQLLFGTDENIWEIKERFGCQIEVMSTENGGNRDRELLLSGPVTSMAKAAAQILQLVTDAKKRPNVSISDDFNFKTWASNPKSGGLRIAPRDPENVSRFVRAVRKSGTEVPLRADSIPKPKIWTRVSFASYVYQLTHMRVSSHLQTHLYFQQVSHKDMVTQILRDIFVDPKCQSAISTSAVNDALEYFMIRSHTFDVRTLFVLMEMRNQPLNTESFNIMLRGAAKIQDLRTFSFILGLMVKKFYIPDSGTWLAFLMVLDDFPIKLTVVGSMKKKGLFHGRGLLKFVCEHLVRDEIEAALDKNLNIAQFMDYMSTSYGSDWLSVSSSNRILDALGNRGLMSSCGTLIDLMLKANVKPNVVTLNTVVHHCQQPSNMAAAVELLSRICSATEVQPDSHTYGTLFNIAWKTHLHSCARVIWRHACLAAETTFRMRKRVNGIMKPALEEGYVPPKLFLPYFKKTPAVAIFITGFDIPPEHNMTVAADTTDACAPHQEPNVAESQTRLENSNLQDLRRHAWVTHVDMNLSMYKKWCPHRPFADVLHDALLIDDDLKLTQRNNPESFDYWREVFARATPVDLIPRTGNFRQPRSWETCLSLTGQYSKSSQPVQKLGSSEDYRNEGMLITPLG